MIENEFSLTRSFADAIAEAEKLIAEAPPAQTEQGLLEGYDYLAGSIRASLQMAWAYQRDFPYFTASTGPYTKMGLDNPDTLYFNANIRADREYLVTGVRGTHRRPELPDPQRRLLAGRGARQPRRVRRPGHRNRRRRPVRAALRPGAREPRAELLHARRGLVDARRPRGPQRLGDREARRDPHPVRRHRRPGAAGAGPVGAGQALRRHRQDPAEPAARRSSRSRSGSTTTCR